MGKILFKLLDLLLLISIVLSLHLYFIVCIFMTFVYLHFIMFFSKTFRWGKSNKVILIDSGSVTVTVKYELKMNTWRFF